MLTTGFCLTISLAVTLVFGINEKTAEMTLSVLSYDGHKNLLFILLITCTLLYSLNKRLAAVYIMQNSKRNLKNGGKEPRYSSSSNEDEDEEGSRGAQHESLLKNVLKVEQSCKETLFKIEKLENLYLPIYSLVFFADWLQGSYIYALYKEYGYDLDTIAVLFVTGFLSSALSSPFCGQFADRYGRRLACCLFCVLYAISCLTKFSSDFQWLIFGRVMGGISTSFLQTTFESWLVAQHKKMGLDQPSLNRIFGKSTFLNGLLAIFSGILANYSVERWGVVSPFVESAILLGVALILMLKLWPENYGEEGRKGGNHASSSPLLHAAKEPVSAFEILKLIFTSSKLKSLALAQTCFESAMYIFVLLWTPMSDEYALEGHPVPYGIVFACFMLSIMLGSQLFTILVDSCNVKPSLVLSLSMYIGGIAMLMLALVKKSFFVFFAFNLFEVCCGLYFSSLPAVRNPLIPESCRSTVLNILRMPMNLVVVFVLLQIDIFSQKFVFCCCCGALLISGFVVERAVWDRELVDSQVVDKDDHRLLKD